MANFGLLAPGALDQRSGQVLGADMQVVALSSQKGGAGKTTLAGHLAVEAVRTGNGPVAIVDTDPQGSLGGWGRARVEQEPVVFAANPEQLPAVLAELRTQGYRLVFVDTPPAVTDAISEVVKNSDLVVIPTRPSPHDLRAVGATVDIVERHERNMIFVVNSATRGARITSEAAVALSQHGTVAPVTVHHRVDFAASMIDGRTVMEKNESGKSSKEIIALWGYIAERLERERREAIEYAQPAEADLIEQQGAPVIHGLAPVQRRTATGFGRRAPSPHA